MLNLAKNGRIPKNSTVSDNFGLAFALKIKFCDKNEWGNHPIQ